MIMSANVEYLTQPTEAFDFDSDPLEAMSTYARRMHQHTQQQMDAATRSARRRSPVLGDSNNTLSTKSSISSSSSRASF